jgi:hypothetical protein
MTDEWKISRGGREWWTGSEPNAWVLAELLRRRWPDDGVITVEHSTPHGFYDAERGLSVDGYLIERWGSNPVPPTRPLNG